MNRNYEIQKLQPVLKEAVWAGEKLGKGIGEAYLFSMLAERPSRLRDGRAVRELVACEMPLVKYIDAAGALSVQVHPRFDGEKNGKDELWIIDDVYENAAVHIGFRRDVSLDEVRRSCEDGNILSLMESVQVAKGDVIYIPGGTIHGAEGISFFEVQHNFDVTYRLFDHGRGRELQIEEGLGNLDLRSSVLKRTRLEYLYRDFLRGLPFFVRSVEVDGIYHPAIRGDYAVVVLNGALCCGKELFAKGDAFLLQKEDLPFFFGKGQLLFVSYGT